LEQIEIHHKIKPQAEQGDKLAHRLLEKWERQKQGISELGRFSREIQEFSTEAKKQVMEGMNNLSHHPDEIRQPYESLQRVTQSLEHLQTSLVEVTSGVEKMMARAQRDARPSPDILRDIQELSGQIQAMKEIVSTYSNGERTDQNHAATVSPLRS
jgi:methyl-accepting chemotaxis protein